MTNAKILISNKMPKPKFSKSVFKHLDFDIKNFVRNLKLDIRHFFCLYF